MSETVTRIISDVHYCDPGSWVHRAGALAPLLGGVDRLIVNGDALDTQIMDDAATRTAELQDFIAAHVPENSYITGNHDPDISTTHELLLAQDRVWVTHGDVYFDDIAPWSQLVPELRRRLSALGAGHSAVELEKIETRFRLFRQACLKLPRELDPNGRGPWAKMLRVGHALFPPNRFLAMLKVWRDLPQVASALARTQRPGARVLVSGHTHHPGVWPCPGGVVVINTGSFCLGRGALLVDLKGERVIVRKIERRKREFRVGETVAAFALAPERVSAFTRTP